LLSQAELPHVGVDGAYGSLGVVTDGSYPCIDTNKDETRGGRGRGRRRHSPRTGDGQDRGDRRSVEEESLPLGARAVNAVGVNRGRLTAVVVVTLAALALIAFVVSRAIGASRTSSAFEAAKAECAEESPHISLLDDGRGLSVAGEGSDAPGASIIEIVCVLDELNVPEAVVSCMDRTRALDGTQDATWGGVRASWTYHPDAGLNIVFEEDT
jgi:hypothetical protein